MISQKTCPECGKQLNTNNPRQRLHAECKKKRDRNRSQAKRAAGEFLYKAF